MTFKKGAEALITALDAGLLPQDDLRLFLRALSDMYVDMIYVFMLWGSARDTLPRGVG